MPRLFLLAAAALSACAAPRTWTVSTVAGSSLVRDGEPAVRAPLRQPEGLAAAPDGRLFIADADDHRVRIVERDGTIRTIAGDGTPGDGPRLRNPYGVAADAAGNVYIADYGNARVLRIGRDGSSAVVAGGGALEPVHGVPAIAARLTSPRNVLADPAGGLYIADFHGNRILRLQPDGTLEIVAGTGEALAVPGPIPAFLAPIRAPAALTLDAAGALIFAETGSGRIMRIRHGVLEQVGWRGYGHLSGVAADPSGNLYVANRESSPMVVIRPNGEEETLRVTGHEVAWTDKGLVYADGSSVFLLDHAMAVHRLAGGGVEAGAVDDDGPAASARFRSPYALARTPSGDILVAEAGGGRVRRIDGTGAVTTMWSGLGQPSGVAVLPDGTVAVSDRERHTIEAVQAGIPAGVLAGTGDPGLDGHVVAAAARVNTPHAVVADDAGNLYFADTGNGLVRRITPAGAVATVAGGGTRTDMGAMAGLEAKLSEPAGLAWAPDGSLLITEMGSGRVRRLSPAGVLAAVTPAGLLQPRGVAVAEDGTVYVAETGAHRIVAIDGNGSVSTFAGTGAAGFAGDGGPAGEALFHSPADVLIAPDGSILVADYGNHRIRRLTPPAKPESATLRLLHAATLSAVALAPGQLATLRDPVLTAGTAILVGGETARVVHAGEGRIDILIPADLADGPVEVTAIRAGETVGSGTAQVARLAPALFTSAGSYAAATNEDGSPHTPENPARRGSVVALYATGMASAYSGLECEIAGAVAELLYAGPAPGLPGVSQINARLPGGLLPPGDVPVRIRMAGVESQAGIVLAVR